MNEIFNEKSQDKKGLKGYKVTYTCPLGCLEKNFHTQTDTRHPDWLTKNQLQSTKIAMVICNK